jgi:stearoyl-CoA desaturase (delta-9 desaturase)
MLIPLAFAAHRYRSLSAQTFFQYRYAAHCLFSMHPRWERFFFLFIFVCQGSGFMSPRGYALLHRLPHAYSDTAHALHYPHNSIQAFDLMWKTRTVYEDVLNAGHTGAMRFAQVEYP